MITIIITGPSGSGKTILSKRLSQLFNNTIVIKTDSFYSDSLLIKFLSILKFDIYDRPFSIKRQEIQNTLKAIYNKECIIKSYYYDFKRKQSVKTKIKINYEDKKQFLILEGIFSHRLDLNYNETINIICEEEKEICFNRRIKRDKIERGRSSIEVNKKFNRSWYLFNHNIKNYINNNQVIPLNPNDKYSYDKLVLKLQNILNNN